jgi:transposase
MALPGTAARTYKHRLYPTSKQQSALGDILWVACALYNATLHYRRKRWQESRHSVTYSN